MPMYVGNAEITGREVLVTTIVSLFLICIGFLIANKIQDAEDSYNVKFYEAVQVSDSTQFNYAFKTNAGHMLAHGTVYAVGSVTDSHIGGEYMSLSRELERYTKHYRTVCSGEGKNRHCHTESYWTWDHVHTDYYNVNRVKMYGKEFRYDEFPDIAYPHYIKTVGIGHHERYVFHGRYTQYTGVLYTNITNHGLSSDSKFADGLSLENAVDYFVKKHSVLVFWILFTIVLVGGGIAFCAAENDWLNGDSDRY